MPPFATFYAVALFFGAGLSLWVAGAVSNSSTRPGRRTFVVLMLAQAWWCFTSGMHALVEPLATRVLLAQWQYFGIATVPPLWFLFAAAYARRPWASEPRVRAWTLAPAAVTILFAWTNASHGLLWQEVRATDGGMGIVYVHGPWFWAAVAYWYSLLAGGTWLLARTIQPGRAAVGMAPFLIAGFVLPWLFNAIYLLRLIPVPGLDLTPVGFALSSVCLLWGFHHHYLLDLVPVSRVHVVDRLPDAVLVVDADHRIIDTNPAARGLPEATASMIGRRASDVFGWWKHLELRRGAPTQAVLTLEDGARFLEVDVCPIDARGGQGFVITLRDTSSRQRTEAEVTALRLQIQEQQRLKGLAELTSGIGVQLAEITRNADRQAQRLSLFAQNSEQKASLDEIVGVTRRASEMVQRLIDHGQPATGTREVIDLDTIVHDVLTLVEASLGSRRDILYRRRIDERLPVHAEATLVRQAVLHALTNACEATEEWDVVRVTTGMAHLTRVDTAEAIVGQNARLGPYAFVEVADTGPGMTSGTLARAVQPQSSTKRPSAGLGLPSLVNIVRLHDGVLDIRSMPGRGTIVRAWFPCAETA